MVKKESAKKSTGKPSTKKKVGKGDIVPALQKIVTGQQSYKEKILNFRRTVIEYYLQQNDYTVAKAAKALKRNRTSLYREITALRIQMPSGFGVRKPRQTREKRKK
ncbi:MAG: hypothetical protein HQK53_05385 [Oligoflexia bacterium]|nr:hypothetical protein [Oligoflexia bacterium]